MRLPVSHLLQPRQWSLFSLPWQTNCQKTSELVLIVSSLWGKTHLKKAHRADLTPLTRPIFGNLLVYLGILFQGWRSLPALLEVIKCTHRAYLSLFCYCFYIKILHMAGSQTEGARKKIYVQYSCIAHNHFIDATHYDVHKASWKREQTLLSIMTFPSK